MQKDSFEKYVSNLKRKDNSIWKTTKIQDKIQNNITPNKQIFNTPETIGKK
jgi:hypothetical protein